MRGVVMEKETVMSAEEMLKKCGFEKRTKDFVISYSDEIGREILFLTRTPLILIKTFKGSLTSLRVEELRAINKQVEELK